jgi:uncharacterized protein YfaP (DUF2135 family)
MEERELTAYSGYLGGTDTIDDDTGGGGGDDESANLVVDMFWSTSGDDFDLHLLAPGGTLRTDTDCYFSNCAGSPIVGHLDWGVVGETEDDPTLVADDISGTGPERITIEEPADGTYTVVVHDYPGSSMTSANEVTVVISLYGDEVWRDTQLISGEDSDTTFAEIHIPEGTVSEP